MFEIYTKEVEIKEPSGNVVKYKLRPLNGRFVKKLFSVVKAFASNNQHNEGDKDLTEGELATKRLNSLDVDALNSLHELAFETFKKSYPNEDEDLLNEFCTQNLMNLIEPLISVNIKND